MPEVATTMGGTLRDEIRGHYDWATGSFKRPNVKFSDSEGRVYSPIDLTGDTFKDSDGREYKEFINVDVGGTERVFAVKAHLGDKLFSVN